MTTVADLPGTWSYLYKPQMTLSAMSGGYESVLAFLTDFANLSDFVLAVAGTAQTITTTWGTMSRIVPLQHPLFPGLYADEVNCRAFGAASESSEDLIDLWSHAEVQVKFRSVRYGADGDQAYMTIEEDKGGMYTTIPGRKFAFPSGEPIDQEAGAFSTTKNYMLTLYQCPDLDSSATDAIQSCVNDDVFLGFPAGQLLFGGQRSIFERSVGGVVRYTKTYTLAYRDYPWNQAYQKNGTKATPVDPAGNPQYASADFYSVMG